jgi:hypothetical protein
MFGVLAFLCIIIGFVVGGFDLKFIVGPLEWFVAAIAFSVLTVEVPKLPGRGE